MLHQSLKILCNSSLNTFSNLLVLKKSRKFPEFENFSNLKRFEGQLLWGWKSETQNSENRAVFMFRLNVGTPSKKLLHLKRNASYVSLEIGFGVHDVEEIGDAGVIDTMIQ